MKGPKLVSNIISICLHFSAIFSFLLPIWYFSKTPLINSESAATVTRYIDIFSYNNFQDIQINYQQLGLHLNTFLSYAFIVFVAITILSSFIYTIIIIFSFSEKSKKYKNIPHYINIFIYSTITLSFITLIIALVFSKITTHESDLGYSISINLSTGTYLFFAIQLAGSLLGFVANNNKQLNPPQDEDDSQII